MWVLCLVAILGGGVASQNTVLYMDPDTSSAPPNDSFKIDFSVADVPPAQPCAGWQIALWWDVSVLHLKRVEEGPFLKQGGPTFFVTNYDDTMFGRVLLGCVILGQTQGVSGSGVLGYGYFQVKKEGETELKMDSLLGSWETYLLDTAIQIIPCEIINGWFKYPMPTVEEGRENHLSDYWCWINTPSAGLLDFSYRLPEAVQVRAQLYNILGEVALNIFDRYESAGEYRKRVRCPLPTGVYFLHLQTKDRSLIRKVVLLRN